ncbi:MAG: protein TolR [Rhodocyclaceae bacterium]|nr:protein TolR [Rhodocyclaceae bacterium]MCB1893496.1 protein TolR [Rhodocyclaceae bacterium]MCP5297789.1 protein TolR [Zoogloeaceae bacterium]MCW5596362.1 protein TolR [Rhodocyclaceae bacterium]
MRQRRLMNQINVVPYIDVMLVLLVIFMVTAPLIQVATVDVPTVGKASQAPSDPLQVIVKADQTLAFRATPNDAPRDVTRDELVSLVTEAQKKNPQQAVVVAGDKNVRYEAVMQVMDALQKQQVARVGLLVQQGQ